MSIFLALALLQAAPANEFPLPFRGRWGTTAAVCHDTDKWAALNVSARGFFEHEVSTNSINVRPLGINKIAVGYSLIDEATEETEARNEVWSLDAKHTTLTIIESGDKVIYTRCK
jgi:hypothetical protein